MWMALTLRDAASIGNREHVSDIVRPSEEAFLPIIWSLTALSFCFLPFRLCTRWLTFRRFFWDDLLTTVAWLLSLAIGTIATLLRQDLYFVTYLSRGKIPPSSMPQNVPERVHRAIGGSLVTFGLFYACLWSIKFGFMLFFWRLGVSTIHRLRLYWWGVFTVTALCFVACFAALPYNCGFGSKVGGGRFCEDRDRRLFEISTRMNCGLDVGTDVLIMTVPFSILWRSNVARRQKWALSGVFGLVLFTIVVAIMRAGLTTIEGRAMNLPWVALWTSIEANIAILIACVGSFRMLYVQHREKQRSGNSNRLKNRSNQGSRRSGPLPGPERGFEELGSEEALDRLSEQGKPISGRI